MPFLTYTDAEDAMLIQFKAAWDAVSPPAAVTIYEDDFQDPPKGTEFVQVYVRHNTSSAVVIGNTRFRRHGMFFVVVHTPAGAGKTRNQFLGLAALHAFQGKNSAPDGVWFRNVSYREGGQEGEYYKGTTSGEFIWDEALPRPALP